MQPLVDVQIQGVDCSVPVEVRVGIVIGISRSRAVGLLVQVEIQRVGAAVVVEITVAQIAVSYDILGTALCF
jgi:hypothetical protein